MNGSGNSLKYLSGSKTWGQIGLEPGAKGIMKCSRLDVSPKKKKKKKLRSQCGQPQEVQVEGFILKIDRQFSKEQCLKDQESISLD